MKIISANTVELTRDALLKAYWTKKPLQAFLIKHGIPKMDTISLLSRYVTKRDYINDLFSRLINTDLGRNTIEKMAIDLATFTSFPDLSICDDVKEKTLSAREAVKLLKTDVDKILKERQDETDNAERKRMSKDLQEKISKNNNDFNQLKSILGELIKDIGSQKSGYDFERWVYDLFSFSEVDTKLPYRTPDGRQIDGSVTIDGTTFLLESKCTKNPTEVTDVDLFKTKILKMADNTMGIMISMTGFTESAIKAASSERTPLLLMDGTHLYNLILAERINCIDFIKKIKRHASHTGSAYLPACDFDK